MLRPDSHTTSDDHASLLADAMLFIRRRHNYGPKRRKDERLALMKRYSQIERMPKTIRGDHYA